MANEAKTETTKETTTPAKSNFAARCWGNICRDMSRNPVANTAVLASTAVVGFIAVKVLND